MKTICVYTCNRSEYSRLKSVMCAIKEHGNLELKILVGGSHLLARFGMTIEDIEGDDFVVDEKIYSVIEGGNLETMAKSTGLAIIEITTYLAKIRPDYLLVVGDRYDVLPAVVSAALQNIPIAHIQGGERTGTIDESVRHVVTKFSHLHFPSTEQSRKFIIQMGEKPENVINTGCPAIDLLFETKEMNRNELFSHTAVQGKIGRPPAANKDYLLLIQHPVTTEHEAACEQMTGTLMAIHDLKMQTLLISPNLDTGSDPMVNSIRNFQLTHDTDDYLYTYRHMPIEVFFNVLRHASCIVGNSSAGIRESGYFGTPCVNIGTRQKNRECGKNVINVGYDRKAIKETIEVQLDRKRYEKEYVYGTGNAGKMIADTLARTALTSQK